MMYSKALSFKDVETAKKILETKEPRIPKELARKVNFLDLSIWNEKAQKIVYQGNFAKFNQNEHLKKILLSTGNKILVEASPHDVI